MHKRLTTKIVVVLESSDSDGMANDRSTAMESKCMRGFGDDGSKHSSSASGGDGA